MTSPPGGGAKAGPNRYRLGLRTVLVLLLLSLSPTAYLFLSARSERADLVSDVAAAETAARALADSLDAARTQLLVDRMLIVARGGDMEQATELASRFFDRVDRRSRVRSASTDETEARLRVLAMRDRTIEALSRMDPSALRLIEEIATLHLSLGDPTLGARIPGAPLPGRRAPEPDSSGTTPDAGPLGDTLGEGHPAPEQLPSAI